MNNNEKTVKSQKLNTIQCTSPDQARRARMEDCANLGMLEWNMESDSFWYSENLIRLLEIKDPLPVPSMQLLIGFFRPSDQLDIQNGFERLAQDHTPFRLHSQILSAKGNKIPVVLSAKFNPDLPGMVGTIQDVSADYKERASLMDTLAKYRGVMESAGDAIILVTQNGGILEGNAKAAEMLEVDESEICNLSVDDIHQCDDLDEMMAHYQAMMWGQTNHVESTIKGQHGLRTKVEITGRPVKIGADQMIVVILHDVSVQHQAQMALKRSERRYRSLVDEAREGILLLDQDSKILAVNPKICEQLGRKRTDLVGLDFSKIADFDLDLSPVDLLNKSPNRQSIHMEGYLQSGDTPLCPTGFNVARYEDEGRIRYSVTAYDLSDVRAGEEDRLQLQKQLFQAQKQELLGQLAGSLAHDFNNLLSPILLVSEALIEDAEEDAFLKKNLSNIHQAAQRARRLVGRILDYTRPEDSVLKPLNLNIEIAETLELLRSSIPHTIIVSENYQQTKTPCLADPDQIHQIIMNLGTNAAQAIGADSGRIDFNIDQITIDETSPYMTKYELPEGNYARIKVMDNGPGIDERYIDEIFDPFFTTKTQTDGSGLGLSVVKRIITNHDGFVEAHNLEQGGACITLYLPMLDEKKCPTTS